MSSRGAADRREGIVTRSHKRARSRAVVRYADLTARSHRIRVTGRAGLARSARIARIATKGCALSVREALGATVDGAPPTGAGVEESRMNLIASGAAGMVAW